MNYLVRYKNFNESKGISDSCEKILQDIWSNIEKSILLMNNINSNFDFSESDFKIKDMKISIYFNKGVVNKCNSIADFKNSFIEDNYLKGVEIEFNIDYLELDESFLYYIKSVIFHEIIHVFQHYNILLGGKFRPESFSIGSILPQVKYHIKTKYVNYIIDVIYYSLSHELSAQLHQYYIYKKEGREYKYLENIKELLSKFNIKKLDSLENSELDFLKTHILNSINYYTTSKKYKKSVNKSLWVKNNSDFLNELKILIDKKLNWLDKKIKLIDKKIIIDYSETFTYYGNLERHKYLEFSIFVEKNLNDCPIIDNI
jgi:hypothetical protein